MPSHLYLSMTLQWGKQLSLPLVVWSFSTVTVAILHVSFVSECAVVKIPMSISNNSYYEMASKLIEILSDLKKSSEMDSIIEHYWVNGCRGEPNYRSRMKAQ